MAFRVPRSLVLFLLIPVGVIAAGYGVILLGMALFSGGNLLGGLGPLGVLIQVLGAVGLVGVLIVWAVKGLVRLLRGKRETPPGS